MPTRPFPFKNVYQTERIRSQTVQQHIDDFSTLQSALFTPVAMLHRAGIISTRAINELLSKQFCDSLQIKINAHTRKEVQWSTQLETAIHFLFVANQLARCASYASRQSLRQRLKCRYAQSAILDNTHFRILSKVNFETSAQKKKASKTVGKYTCLADHEHSLGLLSVSRRKLLQDQINFEYRQLPAPLAFAVNPQLAVSVVAFMAGVIFNRDDLQSYLSQLLKCAEIYQQIVIVVQCCEQAYLTHAQNIQLLINAVYESSTLTIRLGNSEGQTVGHIENLVLQNAQIVPDLENLTSNVKRVQRQDETRYQNAFPHFNSFDCMYLTRKLQFVEFVRGILSNHSSKRLMPADFPMMLRGKVARARLILLCSYGEKQLSVKRRLKYSNNGGIAKYR